MNGLRRYFNVLSAALAAASLSATALFAAGHGDKPNILVIWGDDIGQSNISAYTMGLMGYRTPNIDRIANEVDHAEDKQRHDKQHGNTLYRPSENERQHVLIT